MTINSLPEVLTPSNSDFEVIVTAAFPPGDRKVACEIPQKGADGSGWIGGKVFGRPTIAAGCCTFQMTVERANRANVSIFADPKWINVLPLSVGTVVRIAVRGLELEDIPKAPLTLQKRFVWREGLVVHMKSKTGEEVFVNNFAAQSRNAVSTSPGPSVVETLNASPSTVPMKRKRTPPPPVQETSAHLTTIEHSREELSVLSNESAAAPGPSARMLVDPRGAPSVDESKQANSDSQNPQSLPSPPPEAAKSQPNSPSVDASGSGPATVFAEERPQDVAQQAPRHSHSPPRPPAGKMEKKKKRRKEPQVDPAEPPLRGRAAKKLRLNQERRQRKHAARNAEPDTGSRAQSADFDDDDELWAAAEQDIPDELFNEEVWDQPEAPEVRTIDATQAATTTGVERPPQNDESEPEQPALSRNVKKEPEDPVASLRTACSTQFGKYIPLIEVQDRYRGNIMGVVTSLPEEKTTAKGEYMASFSLSDPSNLASNGLSVTLFNKAEKAFPDPEPGDILLLRNMMGDSYGAVGASFKPWQWAVFHVKTGKVSTAPANTLRHLKADTVELQRSLRLGDWWRDLASSAMSYGVDPAPLIPAKRVREHKLISQVEPGEYFDCTVEVLHGVQNNNSVYDVYMLFVTDYTHHQSMPPTHGSWCPPKLTEVVLPVELWETANARGPTMKPGEFYTIRNIKLKWSGSGYVEGKMVEGPKITKLDEDQLEGEPHLVELLKRKKEWEARANRDGGGHEWPHQLMEEAEKDHHFNCTVEVVHVSPKDDFLYLYVTDYTSRPDLVTVSPSIVTPTVSADRIVRISLYDSQVETARNLEVGDVISIRKLRLHQTGGEGRICGRLGGDERLIMKLNPNSTKNTELRALLKRKEALHATQSKPKPNKKVKEARAARQAKATDGTERQQASPPELSTKAKGKDKAVANSKQYISLADVKASDTCPGVFRVQARVVDFFPDDLRDCVVLRCTSCNETIPKTRRMCTKCDDAMEDDSFVRAFYQLCFRIADEDGTTLDVSVSDQRCSVLKDLEPEDVYEDEDAFDMLVARVRPLLGDLLEVSDGEARRRPVSHDEEGSGGPLLDLTVGSWLPEGESDTAEPRAYIILNHSVCAM
ncbi:hypothetical protein L226DRAFT_609332 [Lentinus tigrinus ALCF2SS1-7]|uniref:Protection of telomeres protein 1 n=1 Tax=Lentinus tigrinus ALCF2SS1-6 TaxID=1328759 RepID=A0A5C2SRL1_9APHY|nr:hypothetical protein L227DRAFT_649214 [Lentinus tigrinus ALCF2SS1-6]RPD80432.1 hypothetical protein L226DRAFT_609332 [Lentinus tigrinus ALCF2SS1-7]